MDISTYDEKPKHVLKASRMRTLMVCLCFVCVPGIATWTGNYLSFRSEVSKTEIYRGIYYSSRLGAHGLIHLIEIDLTRPGVELYLTPVDPVALENGHEYRLDYVRNTAREEGLAVAINGSVFTSDSYLLPMVGDFASTRDTIVADYKLNHLNSRDYLLWFDEALTPFAETTTPAPLGVLKRARWAIGGIDLVFRDNRLDRIRGECDKRSLVGINSKAKRMWLTVCENATQAEATKTLIEAGAECVMTLDGGDSTSLYLGGRTRGVRRGLRFGGQRPVATVIGIRADPILDRL